MFNLYFNIGIIYILIGFVIAFITVFFLKKRVIGKFVGAFIVALFGSFLGGIIEYLFKDIIAYLTNVNGIVNIFPPIIASFIIMFIFVRVSDKKK